MPIRWSIACVMIGRPPILRSGFGRCSVKGRSRVPRPAPKINAVLNLRFFKIIPASSVNLFYLRAGKIVTQNLPGRKSFACHDRRTYLTQPYAVSPSGTVKNKSINFAEFQTLGGTRLQINRLTPIFRRPPLAALALALPNSRNAASFESGGAQGSLRSPGA